MIRPPLPGNLQKCIGVAATLAAISAPIMAKDKTAITRVQEELQTETVEASAGAGSAVKSGAGSVGGAVKKGAGAVVDTLTFRRKGQDPGS